jgi:hypothetical protein
MQLIPEWIKQIKSEDELRNAISDADKQRHAAAHAIIQGQGAAFWRQLLKEFKACVDGLEVLNLRGDLTVTGDVLAEERCRVAVARRGVVPSQTYTNLILFPGSRAYPVLCAGRPPAVSGFVRFRPIR